MKAKEVGIYMDHASAHIMELTIDPIAITSVKSDFTHTVKEETITKSEILMHHKEQHEESDYYKKLAELIRHYEHVLLFGPTQAKMELYNLLNADHRFEPIHIEVRDSDKLTENQQTAFVIKYFSKM
jgi:hypothetical protein